MKLKAKGEWIIESKADFDSIKDETMPATLYQLTTHRYGRKVYWGLAGPRIERKIQK